MREVVLNEKDKISHMLRIKDMSDNGRKRTKIGNSKTETKRISELLDLKFMAVHVEEYKHSTFRGAKRLTVPNGYNFRTSFLANLILHLDARKREGEKLNGNSYLFVEKINDKVREPLKYSTYQDYLKKFRRDISKAEQDVDLRDATANSTRYGTMADLLEVADI